MAQERISINNSTGNYTFTISCIKYDITTEISNYLRQIDAHSHIGNGVLVVEGTTQQLLIMLQQLCDILESAFFTNITQREDLGDYDNVLSFFIKRNREDKLDILDI